MRRLATLIFLAPLTIAGAQGTASTYSMVEPSALEDSLLSIPSSSQRARAVRSYAQTDDRATLLSAMRIARTIPNSEDKSRLLEMLAPRYLGSGDRTLYTSFFRVARTVPSSEELRDLLIDVVPFAAKSDELAIAILDMARMVPSSPDRSDVLTALVESGAVRSNDVRESFADVLQTIPAEQDRQRVARAAMKVVKE